MKGLAFDLGTKCGWCAYDGAQLHYGLLKLAGGRYEGGGMRYLRFRQHLTELAERVQPEWVVFEEVRRHAGTDAAHVYGGLLATLTSFCEERELPYEGVAVGTIKKHFCGSGNASKDQMMMEAKRRGHHPETDDVADAIAIMDFKLEQVLM